MAVHDDVHQGSGVGVDEGQVVVVRRVVAVINNVVAGLVADIGQMGDGGDVEHEPGLGLVQFLFEVSKLPAVEQHGAAGTVGAVPVKGGFELLVKFRGKGRVWCAIFVLHVKVDVIIHDRLIDVISHLEEELLIRIPVVGVHGLVIGGRDGHACISKGLIVIQCFDGECAVGQIAGPVFAREGFALRIDNVAVIEVLEDGEGDVGIFFIVLDPGDRRLAAEGEAAFAGVERGAADAHGAVRARLRPVLQEARLEVGVGITSGEDERVTAVRLVIGRVEVGAVFAVQIIMREFPLERARGFEALQDLAAGLHEIFLVGKTVEKGGAGLAEEGLPQFGEVGAEIGRGEHQEMADRTRPVHVMVLVTQVMQREPGARDERTGAVAGDIDGGIIGREGFKIIVEFVGKVPERGIVIHAAVIDEVDVCLFIETGRDEEIRKRCEARGAIGIAVDD